MRSFPFDSLALYQDEKTGLWVGDRQSTAQDVRDINKIFWKNGVVVSRENAFQVTPGEGMNVIVAPGICGIEGTLGVEVAERGMTLQASSSEDRIDTIVLRLNLNVEARKIDLYVKTGVAQSVPVRPQLTRSESVWELGIADIFVAKNSGAISAARITDTRLQTERCGVMSPLMEVDTTTFFEQLQAQTQIAVDLAQDAIDGTIAGNLQSQINENDEDIEQLQTDLATQQKNLGSIFSDKTFSKSYSIVAGGTQTVNVDIEKPSGFAICGIRSYSTGGVPVSATTIQISSNTKLTMGLVNHNQSSGYNSTVSVSLGFIRTAW